MLVLAGSWSSVVNVVNSTLKDNTSTKGGVMVLMGSNATLVNCNCTNNTAHTAGGAVAAYDSLLAITNSTFEFNRARAWLAKGFVQSDPLPAELGFGGACLFIDSNVTIDACTFASNTALEGGAAWVGGSEHRGEAYNSVDRSFLTTILNTTLRNNSAAMGGALLAASPAEFEMEGVNFVENTAGMAALEGSDFLFRKLKLSKLYHGVGGAMFSDMATVRITGGKLDSNTAVFDGGEHSDNSQGLYALSCTGCAPQIRVDAASAELTGCTSLCLCFGLAVCRELRSSEFRMGFSVEPPVEMMKSTA